MTKWVTKKLGEIGRVVSGLTYSPNNVVNDGVLVLRSSNIQNDNICLEDNVYVNVTEYNPVQDGDVLICVRNGSRALIGKTARINKDIEGCAFGAFMAIYRSEYNDYLYHFFKSDNFFSQVSRNIGATINSINGSDLKNMEVVFPIQADGTPDLAEQRRIAGILSSADGAIAASEALIEKYRNIKRGLLTTLLQPKEGWKKVKFDDFFDFLPTNTLSRDKLNDQCGTYQNIHYGDVLIKYPFCLDCNSNEMPFINEDVNFNKAEIKDGDVVFADTAEDDTVGKCVEILNVGEKKIVAGLHTYLCRPKYKMALGYLGYFLNSDTFHDQLLRYIAGSKVSSVNKTSIKNTYIYYPEDLTEQRRIAEILSSVDAKIAAEEKVVEKYKGVKKGLMEEMMGNYKKGNDK